jgi:drug/metabolite transporter (DMT)-like permease
VTAVAIALCVLCQFFVVLGQILLKRGMSSEGRKMWWNTSAGTACMAAWFFLWVGLLQSLPLSQIFPFEGLNPALLMLAAWLFLRERVPWTAWIGIGLITFGVVLVSGS